jgi:hypothetical protein
LFLASQASDVGSIPIARSINPDESISLTRLSCSNSAQKWTVLDGSWTEVCPIGRKFARSDFRRTCFAAIRIRLHRAHSNRHFFQERGAILFASHSLIRISAVGYVWSLGIPVRCAFKALRGSVSVPSLCLLRKLNCSQA